MSWRGGVPRGNGAGLTGNRHGGLVGAEYETRVVCVAGDQAAKVIEKAVQSGDAWRMADFRSAYRAVGSRPADCAEGEALVAGRSRRSRKSSAQATSW